MNHAPLSDHILTTLDIYAQIASAGVNGGVFDMQGWEGIEYEFSIGTMASGATFDARLVGSANSNMSGNANITNAAITQVTNGSNANLVILDLYNPSLRYVKLVTTPATANTTFSVTARQYRRTSGVVPVTQATTTLQRLSVVAN